MHTVHAQDSVCFACLERCWLFPLSLSISLSRTVVNNAVPASHSVSVSSSSSVHCIVQNIYPVVSRNTHPVVDFESHCCVPPPPPSSHLLLSPLPSSPHYRLFISCDTMHHGPSLCMDCVSLPAQTSGRRASVTLCLMLYSR